MSLLELYTIYRSSLDFSAFHVYDIREGIGNVNSFMWPFHVAIMETVVARA